MIYLQNSDISLHNVGTFRQNFIYNIKLKTQSNTHDILQKESSAGLLLHVAKIL